jgi:hypothetical protein
MLKHLLFFEEVDPCEFPAISLQTDLLALSRTPRGDWIGHREFYSAQLRDCRETDLLCNLQWPPRLSNQKDADLFF